MKLETDAVIPFPRPLVYQVLRERLPDLVRYLPNVRRIECRSRREVDGRIEFVNEWDGGGEIPAVARAFVSESLLTWTDYASWVPAEWACYWRMETHAFRGLLRTEGSNRYFDQGATTRMEIRGVLEIDVAKLTMVPRLLAPSVARSIEAYIIGHVRPNQLNVAASVGEYLRDHPDAA